MRRGKEIYAIPMWLNGRAYLKPALDYRDVCNPVTGEILRKIPLFGAEEMGEALRSAGGSLAAWNSLGESGRKRLLSSLADALHDMRAHFSRLLAEETGKDEESASRDVQGVVSCLREPQVGMVTGVVAVPATSKGFLEVAVQGVAALTAGAALVICPSSECPSALLALAELSGSCGFPAGVLNVIYPSDEALVALHKLPGITVLT